MIIRSSMLKDIKSCPSKAAYKYELGLVPIAKGQRIKNDLEFGKLIHEAIEIFHTASIKDAIDLIDVSPMHETKRKNRQTAKVLLRRYADSNSVEIQHLEKSFQFKIGSHTWQGRFDGIGIYQGDVWVIEHKTTNPLYLQIKPNDQFIAYWLGAMIHFQNVKGVLINNLDCDKLEVTRIPVQYTKEEKEEWLDEIKITAEVYSRYRTKGVFPRNDMACHLYNSVCPYMALCSEPEGTRDMIMARCYEVKESLKLLEW